MRRLVVIGGALGALIAAAGCGSTGYNTAALSKDIKTRLDEHPGFAVRSVSCPARAKRAEGVVIRCSATPRDGEVDQMRATQTDDNGTIHLVGSLIFADNVERAVQSNLPATAAGAHVVCPNHVPVVIGHTFACGLADAGSYTTALITIIDEDGGFRMSFS